MFEALVSRSNVVPSFGDVPGDGLTRTMQLDTVLMDVGFKLSRPLMMYLAKSDPREVLRLSNKLLPVVRKMVGDHVPHNTYFINFPNNVPVSFLDWHKTFLGVSRVFNKAYGNYHHTYDDMVRVHDDLERMASEKMKFLELGKTEEEECEILYNTLVGSTVPLSEVDRGYLNTLAMNFAVTGVIPVVPVRENLAIVNAVRINSRTNLSIKVDSLTDVLRIAAHLSYGDPTLTKPGKFKSLPRGIRRELAGLIKDIVVSNPNKIADVYQHQEMWKRLGERIHPHEFHHSVRQVFATARGETDITSFASAIETSFAKKDPKRALRIMTGAPGILIRSVDRLLVAGCPGGDVSSAVEKASGEASGRVLLSLREHLLSRTTGPTQKRFFGNKKGRGWSTDDKRPTLDTDDVDLIKETIDNAMVGKIPQIGSLTVDPDILGVAIPLSEKQKTSGVGILPRGSEIPLHASNIRFFMYWKQKQCRTDYDLSATLLDEYFNIVEQCSFTMTRSHNMVHSGDITDATNGASEFIDVDLGCLPDRCVYVVPQVNYFTGEDFNEVEEVFFGYMERDSKKTGKPFEPSTVKVKSSIRGNGKVALPMVFKRSGNGWLAKWTHLYLKGTYSGNMVERNGISTSDVLRGIVHRKYLTVSYIADMMMKKCTDNADDKKLYVGFNRPGDLDDKTSVLLPQNLLELVPR